jgi:hypothetical protein
MITLSAEQQLPNDWDKFGFSFESENRTKVNGHAIIARYGLNGYKIRGDSICIYEDESQRFYIAPHGFANDLNGKPILEGPFESFEAAYTVYRINNYESLI